MKHRLTTAFVFVMIASTVVADKNKDLSQIPVPTERNGIEIEVLAENSLAEQIPAFAGYDLRMRKITFAPGDTLQQHSHAVRPGMVYILEGEIVETRNDERRVFKAGEFWIEDASTDHWLVNVSDEPAVFIMVDTPVQE